MENEIISQNRKILSLPLFLPSLGRLRSATLNLGRSSLSAHHRCGAAHGGWDCSFFTLRLLTLIMMSCSTLSCSTLTVFLGISQSILIFLELHNLIQSILLNSKFENLKVINSISSLIDSIYVLTSNLIFPHSKTWGVFFLILTEKLGEVESDFEAEFVLHAVTIQLPERDQEEHRVEVGEVS
jgi:hypothetical protein